MEAEIQHMNNKDLYQDFIFYPHFRLYDGGSRVKTLDNLDGDLHHRLIQYIKHPLSDKCRWFKMKVEELKDGFIMFGLNKCCKEFGGPQWHRTTSIRYASDNGGIYTKGVGLRSDNTYGKGDEVMCLLEKSFPDKSVINFFKNGKLVYRQWVYLENDNLYATIGISKGPVTLSVDWPHPGAVEPPIRQDLVSNWIGYKDMNKTDTDNTLLLANEELDREAYSIQAPRSFNKDFSFFEVEILTRVNDKKGPCIGVAGPWFNKYRVPGWEIDSFGYHGDDGATGHGMPDRYIESNEDWKCKEGDRLGLGIIYPKGISQSKLNDNIPVVMYVTKNRQYLTHRCALQSRGGFYPTVTLFSQGDKLKLLLPNSSPVLPINLENELEHQKAMVTEFRFSQRVDIIDFIKYKGSKIEVTEDKECPYRMARNVHTGWQGMSIQDGSIH